MKPEMITAFTLLITGMLTVFIVLLLVVLTGNLLIRLVNRFSGEVVETQKSSSLIDPKKIAAINAAVEVFTGGKGSVTRIEQKK